MAGSTARSTCATERSRTTRRRKHAVRQQTLDCAGPNAPRTHTSGRPTQPKVRGSNLSGALTEPLLLPEVRVARAVSAGRLYRLRSAEPSRCSPNWPGNTRSLSPVNRSRVATGRAPRWTRTTTTPRGKDWTDSVGSAAAGRRTACCNGRLLTTGCPPSKRAVGSAPRPAGNDASTGHPKKGGSAKILSSATSPFARG